MDGAETQQGHKPAFSNPEIARRAALRSAEVRRERRALSPEQQALEAIRRSADKLTRELLDAALGRGDFVELSPSDRLKATIKALEYAVGRPTTGSAKNDDSPELPTAEGLFG